MRLLSTIAIVLIPWSLFAQLEKSGTPVSWNLTTPLPGLNMWHDLESMNALEVYADVLAAEEDRSKPIRFAVNEITHYNLSNSGTWTNLPNGDRIWLMGLRCETAFGLGITFGHLNLPPGSQMYIFNEDRTDFIGPITPKNNRIDGPLALFPLSGDHIYIEYYEPFTFRGDGDFNITTVSKAFRDFSTLSEAPGGACIQYVDDASHSDIRDEASSVLMMITDNGTRLATAVLVNNALNDGKPYALTAMNAVLGDPERMVFVFDNQASNCSDISCWNQALSGAVLKEDVVNNGMALLQLLDRPKNDWRAYFAGWNAVQGNGGDFTTLQYALCRPQSYAFVHTILTNNEFNGFETRSTSYWDDAAMFEGAVGSPLFNQFGQLVGIYLGGEGGCNEILIDHFAFISDSWSDLKGYLDPLSQGNTLVGLYPKFIDTETEVPNGNFVLYPNPSDDIIFIQNNSGNPIQHIVVYNAIGSVVQMGTPLGSEIDLNQLSPGQYFLRIQQVDDVQVLPVVIR